MRELLKNKIVRFLIVAAGLYVFWLIIYFLIIKAYTDWDYLLNNNIVELSDQLMTLFGFETYIDTESDHVVLMMHEGLNNGVWVGDECNGFKLFSIFAIFILTYPGQWKTKLWFIPTGIILIHLANVIRVCALAYISNYYPTYLDFNHLYTFTIFVYSIIFLLWLWYAKKIKTETAS